MTKTIKGKLLSVLLSFVFITILTSLLAFNYFVNSKDSLSDITQKTESIHVLLLQDIKIMHEFFENETINPAFFYSGKSDMIESHRRICTEIKQALIALNKAQEQSGFSLTETINGLEINFSDYVATVDNMITQILKRGFKDYGIEGKMRQYAHLLENYDKEVGLVNILQLRRHEKDFIIRQEDQYVKKHRQLISEIHAKIYSNKSLPEVEKHQLLQLINNYSDEFRTLVVFEKKLGLRNEGGLKKDVDSSSGMIESSLASLVQISREKVSAAIIRMEFLFLVIGLLFTLISVVSAAVIARRILRSVSHLKNKIALFVESDFTQRTVLPINDSVNEIDVLITNVSIMEQYIVDQMSMLKQTNNDLEMLFYATSRDLKAPLITVKGLLDNALAKTSDKNALMYFELMRESWQELYNIIDELGIIINIRNAEIKTEAIELEQLVKGVFSEFKALERFDNVIFSMDFRIKNSFFSSPGLTRAIFRNMIENSIKYSTKREKQSFLKVSVVDQSDDMIRIEISDNGIGIKKEFHEKIFDMFFRGTTYAGGTGLGLYIVKCSIVKLNGAIQLESDEETGSTFTIILPNNSKAKNMKEKIIQKIEAVSLQD